MRKVSEKRLAQLGGRVPSSTITGTRKAIRKKNPERVRKNFLRAYGDKDRVLWIRAQDCLVCGVSDCTENAHVAPKREAGGTGRKADAKWNIPLCGPMVRYLSVYYARHDGKKGCHTELHQIGRESFEAKYGVNLEQLAIETQARWLAIADQSGRGPTTKGSEVK